MNRYPQNKDPAVIKEFQDSLKTIIKTVIVLMAAIGVMLIILLLTQRDARSLLAFSVLLLLVIPYWQVISEKIRAAQISILIFFVFSQIIIITSNPGGLLNPVIAMSLPFFFAWTLMIFGAQRLKYVVPFILFIALLAQIIHILGISEKLSSDFISSEFSESVRSSLLIIGTLIAIGLNSYYQGNLFEKAVAMKERESSFLARMSHEIRNPLHAIQSLIDSTFATQDINEIHENLQTMDQAASQLKKIADEILDYRKLEGGMYHIQPAAFNLHELLEKEAQYISSIAANAGITHTSKTVLADLPEYIIGDQYRLRQIAANLVGNAIKYSEPGTEIITETTYDAARGLLEFTVKDSGIGMSDETLANLFIPYAVALDNPLSAYGGTGLGLVITKGLVDAMGGTLTVESELGKGSTFVVSHPAPIPATAPKKARKKIQLGSPTEPESGPLDGFTIMCVDDDPLNLRSIERPLQAQGAEVYAYEDPREALACALTKDVDLVLTDITMPHMDGVELMKKIKAEKPNLQVITITGHALPNEIDLYKQQGFTTVITKPFKSNDLLLTVLSVLNQA